MDELDQYAFVVRGRVGQYISPKRTSSADEDTLLDRETEETTFHVDIKSEWLRDILRDMLKDVQVISLKEGKLSVGQPLYRSETRYLAEIRLNKNCCFTIFLNLNHAKSGMRSLRSTSWA